MSSSSQSHQIKTHFKTAEGRYKLSHEKAHPTGMMYYTHHRGPTKVTVAHLKERSQAAPPPPAPAVASTTSRFMPKLSFSSSNGKSSSTFVGSFSSRLSVGSRSSSLSGSSAALSSGPLAGASADAEGTYLLFNVGESLFISDYNTTDKDPIKSLHFPGVRSLCHAFNPEAKDGHDLLIGTDAGDVYTASLRQQLQDSGRKLVGANHLNKDGAVCNSKVTALAWLPTGDGQFVAAHADGNLFLYDKARDGSGEVLFPPLKDPASFSVARARASKSNPVARWHISASAINDIAFSADGQYLATAGRDGYLRLFDWPRETLMCGCKSYYGALLCCAFSPDGKYVLGGGEDDLVHIWSMEEQRVVAWGEGHASWVSSVAFDPFWRDPGADAEGPTAYRFGSVAQDAQLLLWDLSLEEVVVPLRPLPATAGSSSSSSSRSASAASPSGSAPEPSTPSSLAAARLDTFALTPRGSGVLKPPPARREVPKLAPITAHKVHTEPLAGILFCKDSILTTCHEGHIMVWLRPGSDPLAGGAQGANGASPAAGSADARTEMRVDSPAQQWQAVR